MRTRAALPRVPGGQWDVPRLIGLYRSGRIELDTLLSRRYQLADINAGFTDLLAGRNARAVIDHSV
jgi:alcohol dehydrogenase (nicotinoprotein)